MKQNDIKLAKLLTYSGTLPIIGCFILIYKPIAEVNFMFIALAYSAVIVSFLSGIHWAIYIFFSEKCPKNLLLSSNLIALLAWTSLLAQQQKIAILLQILCFLYLFLLDSKLFSAKIIPDWFYFLRRNATIIVVIFLAAILL